MPPDPDPEVPDWFKREQERQAVAAKLGTIEKGVGDIKDTLNKILIALIGLGGGTVGLRLVQTTPQQVFTAFISGYLAIFGTGIVLARWGLMSRLLRLIMILFTTTGWFSIVNIGLGPSPIIQLGTTITLTLLLGGLSVFAWQIEHYRRK